MGREEEMKGGAEGKVGCFVDFFFCAAGSRSVHSTCGICSRPSPPNGWPPSQDARTVLILAAKKKVSGWSFQSSVVQSTNHLLIVPPCSVNRQL